MSEYTVLLAVVPDGAHEPRLVLKHVTASSAPIAIAEATAAVLSQHDAGAPRVGDALVFDGKLEIASEGRRTRRDRTPPSSLASVIRADARRAARRPEVRATFDPAVRSRAASRER